MVVKQTPGIHADAWDKVPLSPQVHPDRRVTFRLFAPLASEVALVSGAIGHIYGTQPMIKDETGVWQITLGPLEPDIYDYGFAVDGGLRSVDPANANVENLGWGSISWVHVSGDVPAYYEIQPVPHGDVHIHWYESSVLKEIRPLWVYTPPAYESTDIRYPVLYLLHGAGQREDSWIHLGCANIIADNLLSVGQSRPLVIVMPYGHRKRHLDLTDHTPWAESIDLFGRELLQDIMPYAESRYRIAAERSQRALAGLSMGGAQTIQIGFTHPGLFGSLGSFSTPMDIIDTSGLLAALQSSDVTPDLLWIGCSEKDWLYEGNLRFRAQLEAAGLPYIWQTGKGGHSWVFYRPSLRDFLSQLFMGPSEACKSVANSG